LIEVKGKKDEDIAYVTQGGQTAQSEAVHLSNQLKQLDYEC